jgi:hypothetical protein
VVWGGDGVASGWRWIYCFQDGRIQRTVVRSGSWVTSLPLRRTASLGQRDARAGSFISAARSTRWRPVTPWKAVAWLARGERPDLPRVLLSPGSVRRLAERLSEMRGAVMKVGQLRPMGGHGGLPLHLAEVPGGLCAQAHWVPASQTRSGSWSSAGRGSDPGASSARAGRAS